LKKRSITIIIAIVFFSTIAFAADFASYRNLTHKYAITYPANWERVREDAKYFSVLDKSSNVNININSEELPPNDKRKYNRITDIPKIREGLADIIKKGTKSSSVESGPTVLSKEKALWFKYRYIQRSPDTELYFVVYQIVVLKNDIRYTVTYKVSGPSQKEADMKFKKYWPIMKTSIASFKVTYLDK